MHPLKIYLIYSVNPNKASRYKTSQQQQCFVKLVILETWKKAEQIRNQFYLKKTRIYLEIFAISLVTVK